MSAYEESFVNFVVAAILSSHHVDVHRAVRKIATSRAKRFHSRATEINSLLDVVDCGVAEHYPRFFHPGTKEFRRDRPPYSTRRKAAEHLLRELEPQIRSFR